MVVYGREGVRGSAKAHNFWVYVIVIAYLMLWSILGVYIYFRYTHGFLQGSLGSFPKAPDYIMIGVLLFSSILAFAFGPKFMAKHPGFQLVEYHMETQLGNIDRRFLELLKKYKGPASRFDEYKYKADQKILRELVGDKNLAVMDEDDVTEMLNRISKRTARLMLMEGRFKIAQMNYTNKNMPGLTFAKTQKSAKNLGPSGGGGSDEYI